MPIELGNEQMNGIVSWNEPTLRTGVCLVMANTFGLVTFRLHCTKNTFFQCQNRVFCEAVLEASNILLQTLCTKILDRYNTAFLIPTIAWNISGILENLYGFLLISLESARILTKHPLYLVPDFLGKSFLVPYRAVLFLFHELPNRCPATSVLAKQHFFA